MSQDSDQRLDSALRSVTAEAITEHSSLDEHSAIGEQKLAELRRELDGIDDVLRGAIRDRIDVCVRVAHVKREHAIAMMQPGRVGLVTERARNFATANGLSPDFLEDLYRSMIAEACRVEDLIIDSPVAGLSHESER